MRSLSALIAVSALGLLTAGCNNGMFGRERPDEFAVARQAPLVIPPDYALVPPRPGAARPQDRAASAQALDALFGGRAARSAGEAATLDAAGAPAADAGVRSQVGSPDTSVVDRGATTRDIVAAPEGNGRDTSVSTPQ